MLEFDQIRFKSLCRGKFKYSELADMMSNAGIPTTEDAIKAWMRKKNPSTPEYEKISFLAELFGIPSLHLFRGGEDELTKNIQLELKRNPDKYEKYFNRPIKSKAYQEIIDQLEKMDNERLNAVMTIIKGLSND